MFDIQHDSPVPIHEQLTGQIRAHVASGALAAGALLGEYRAFAQELLTKTAVLGARWHFLGQLQRNKVRQLAPWVTCWQSVDRAELGAELARRAPGARSLPRPSPSLPPCRLGC